MRLNSLSALCPLFSPADSSGVRIAVEQERPEVAIRFCVVSAEGAPLGGSKEQFVLGRSVFTERLSLPFGISSVMIETHKQDKGKLPVDVTITCYAEVPPPEAILTPLCLPTSDEPHNREMHEVNSEDASSIGLTLRAAINTSWPVLAAGWPGEVSVKDFLMKECEQDEKQCDISNSNDATEETPTCIARRGGLRRCFLLPCYGERYGYCGLCQLPLPPSHISVDGRKYHRECMLCDKCTQPLGASFFDVNYKFFCDQCGEEAKAERDRINQEVFKLTQEAEEAKAVGDLHKALELLEHAAKLYSNKVEGI